MDQVIPIEVSNTCIATDGGENDLVTKMSIRDKHLIRLSQAHKIICSQFHRPFVRIFIPVSKSGKRPRPSFHLLFSFLITEVQCKHPKSVKDGFIEVSNFRGKYVFGSLATYHCNPGYILWGNASRLCGHEGTWSGKYSTAEKQNASRFPI